MPVANGVWHAPDRAFLNALPGQSPVPKPIKTRGGADAWRVSDLRKMNETPIHQLSIARGIGMDIEQHAVEVSGAAEEAMKSLKDTLDKFRGVLANDLTAIKAAASRVQSETLQMKQSYLAAQAVLTAPEFERAIANAERMATALQSISALSETKLSVAVFSGGGRQGG